MRQSRLEIEFQIETNLIFLCDGIKYIFKYLSSFFFSKHGSNLHFLSRRLNVLRYDIFFVCLFFFFVYIYSRNYCYARSVFMESDKLAVPRINSCIGRFNLSDQFFFFFCFFFSFLFILFFFHFFFFCFRF